MKFRIQSRARSSQPGRTNGRVKSKLIYINEVLEFDHLPTGEEILSAIAGLPKYRPFEIQLLETLAIKKLPD